MSFSNDTLLQKIWDHLIAKVSGNAAPNYGLSPFGEQLMVQLTPTTGWSFIYNINTDFCTITTVGSGTTSVSVGRGRVHSGAAINSSARIETERPLRYIPGVGAVVRFTATFAQGVAGSTQLVGIGDDEDGFFFGFNGNEFGILRRGAGADSWITQDEWNVSNTPICCSNLSWICSMTPRILLNCGPGSGQQRSSRLTQIPSWRSTGVDLISTSNKITPRPSLTEGAGELRIVGD